MTMTELCQWCGIPPCIWSLRCLVLLMLCHLVISVQSLHCKSAVDMSPVQNVSACIEGPCRWHCRCHYYYEYINVMLSLCSFWLCVCCAVTDAALHSFAVRFESYGFIFIGQSLFALAKTGLKTKYIKTRVGQCWHLWFGQFLDAD